MIWAVVLLGCTQIATVAAWYLSNRLDAGERRILLAAALEAQGKTVAATRAGKNTAAEDRERFEEQQKKSAAARAVAAPFSALNPFGP